jgi:UbiD family decarboxylase
MFLVGYPFRLETGLRQERRRTMTLESFLNQLDKRSLLAHVNQPVDARYELAAVAARLGERPVLFSEVTGYDMPVASNICASRELVRLGLDAGAGELVPRMIEAIDHPREPEVGDAAQYEERPADLSRLPIPTHYPRDGGPYIASGIVFCEDRDLGLNASYHRAMVLGADRLVLRILPRHLHEYMQRGLTSFAICIGNTIPVLLGAAMSVELDKSELAIANALHPTEAVRLAGHLIPLSELVLICEFTGETADEGPFLDLTETFDIVRQQPVARVKQIFSRPASVYHALLPGGPEHKILMGMPREPTIFREVSRVCDCLDVRITPGGCSWLHAAVKIRKQRGDDGRKAIEAAFAGHSSLKHVFVVDEDIDIDDPRALEWALATRFQGDRDLVLRRGEKGSSLDPSADPETRETTKLGFDLTVPAGAAPEKFQRPGPPMAVDPADYLEG